MRITGGRVITRAGIVEADVWIEGDTVVAVGGEGRLSASSILDASGMLVGPGFVDLHTHLRDPGQTWKEDVSSGSKSAAVGGYTAIVAMPNTDPAIDNVSAVEAVRRSAESSPNCLVEVAASLTLGREGKTLVDFAALHAAGVRLFTDDGDSLLEPGLLREAMLAVAKLEGALIAQHAEDTRLSEGGHMHDGEVSARLGVAGIPSAAEWTVIERDLALVAETGARYHAQHLSTGRAVEMMRQAKADGLPVSAEVTPHHLTFTEDALGSLDSNLKMYPPLRTGADRDALVGGLFDGTIDLVATDHAPHSRAEKDVSFDSAPRGVIGLETAASAVWEALADPMRLFEVMSLRPARLAGIERHGVEVGPGSPANLVIFDPDRVWVPESFVSKSANSPYLGRSMTGRVAATVYEGRITHEMERIR
jgi:dihydroorotase